MTRKPPPQAQKSTSCGCCNITCSLHNEGGIMPPRIIMWILR